MEAGGEADSAGAGYSDPHLGKERQHQHSPYQHRAELSHHQSREVASVLDAARPATTFSARRLPLPKQADLEQIFTQYADPIYRFLYSRVGNRQDAEDLTSEVFYKAARELDSARSQTSIASWLFTVARSILADYWRRYYRTGIPVSLDESRYAEVVEPEAVPDVPDEGESGMVVALLATLPERYRRVLELRFLHGYSIKETARELDLTPENVKVIQHRALAKALQVADGRL